MFAISACAAPSAPTPSVTPAAPQLLAPADNPYAAQPDDAKRLRAETMLTSAQLSERIDLDPPRVQVNLLGVMTDACQQLRIQPHLPDGEYRIFIEIYSVSEPSAKCENVFRQFEVNILLGVYSPGRYTLWVNNQRIGDFVSY
ncbi:MAG: hypothetical protein Fur002_03630 [Anaerolineales bacterium]